MIRIKVSKDESEIVPYNFTDFPVHSREYRVSYYPDMRAVSHWHEDLEFAVVLEGRMLFSVDGTEKLLEKGQGIFVNAGHLHYAHAFEREECRFLCILFNPSLLYVTQRMKSEYIKSAYANSSKPFLMLFPEECVCREIISDLNLIYKDISEELPGFELAVISNFYSVWYHVLESLNNMDSKDIPAAAQELEVLRYMIGYIQRHFQKKLFLQDIAAAGNVCRSRCCQIFKSVLHVTPMQYLNDYRLEKSIEYLRMSEYSITDIALLCGFGSSSYFTELFRKKIGRTPTKYLMYSEDKGI